MSDCAGNRLPVSGVPDTGVVPPGLRPVTGAAAWYGEQLARDTAWMHRFKDNEIDELLTAARYMHAQGKPLQDVGRSEFPLPTLGPRLEEIRAELIRGRGFVLFTGFPASETTKECTAAVFWGISQYLGSPVPQNAEGHLIGHITDLGADMSEPNARVYATNHYHRFHTDSVDIVGLLCLQNARRGGVSSLVSSVSVYNELAADRPDLARELFRPFPVARKGEIPAGKEVFYMMPVFHWHEKLLSAIFSRDFIEASQHHSAAPRLTELQVEAMDALEELAEDPRLKLEMNLKPGEMQFLHNHQILHARSAYQDWHEEGRKRHLLRIWLCPPDGRVLPDVYSERYGSVEVGRRGGVYLPGVLPSVPILDVVRPWWMRAKG